jgi:hypothetical protein
MCDSSNAQQSQSPNPKDLDTRIAFTQKAIDETQATIRALDAKAVALLVFLVVPLTAAVHLRDGMRALALASYSHFWLMVIAWVVAAGANLLTLGAIASPADRVPGDHPSGTYFGAGLYRLSFLDLLPWTHTKAVHGTTEWLARCPQTQADVLWELAFEQIKLVYIRDVKMLRLKLAYYSVFAGLVAFVGAAFRLSGI